VRMALYQYCLYDGCANATNFHMAARFEDIRLSELIEAMSWEASQKGFDSNITKVKDSIDAASAEINSWGDADASPDQNKAAWMNIMSAAKESHNIFIALNSSASSN